MDQKLFDRGMQIRRNMYGTRADEELAQATDFTRPLHALVTTYCFGEIWDRPGLSHKTRSMLTVAMLIALNRQGPLQAHVDNALNNGVTKDELMEIILHAAVYCGVPAAADATRSAVEVFKRRGIG